MRIADKQLFKIFRYSVYLLLAFNVCAFWNEEFKAALLQFPAGVPNADLIEAYASTIDTAAWLVLLLMFDLETGMLDDKRSAPLATWFLHGMRFFCYVFIVYAFYGYLANLDFVYDTNILTDMHTLCGLVPDNWSYAIDLDEYERISATNCASLSGASQFHKFAPMQALVDSSGLADIRRLAWTDAINAGTWLAVILVLEIDVRLKDRGHLEAAVFRASAIARVALYSVLFLCAVYWGYKGDFVDFWDAFLWLVAFFFIEFRLTERRTL